MFRSEYIQNESCATELVKVKELRLPVVAWFCGQRFAKHPMTEQLLKSND